MTKKFILAQDDWYIADWGGDPPRTLKIQNAKLYNTAKGAKIAKAYYEKRYRHIRKMDLNIFPVVEDLIKAKNV